MSHITSFAESDLVFVLLPNLIAFFELVVVHLAFLLEQSQHLVGFKWLKSVVEKASLLQHEPSSQVVISAISQSTDEVGNIVVFQRLFKINLLGLLVLDSFRHIWVNDTFDIESVLSRVFIDFMGDQFLGTFLISVIQELDLLEDLQPADGDVLEFVDADYVLRWLVIKTYVSSLGVANAFISTTGIIAHLSVLYFLLIHNHCLINF